MLDKMAGSKWRQMVRDGKLGSYALGELREMGLHGTKETARKELAGIARGNKALLKALKIDTRPGANWTTSRRGGLIDLLLHGRPTTDRLITYPVVPTSARSATMLLKSTRPLAMRHEIDETRLRVKLQRVLAKRLKREPTEKELRAAVASATVIGGHISPEVLVRESGHANIVGGATREHMMEMRRMSGEDSQLRRQLGMGYGKLDSTFLRTKAGKKRLKAMKNDRNERDVSVGRDAAVVSAWRRLLRRLSH